ncbi:cytochrome c biogenesis CcdA family protein [Virgibacillus sp. W0430]|uniref:cytochrome c biogenesis CcdA family protein n=1 Tax=Virgibacillus sp. W0430 TaxID=3391580 RepID=UPI003F467D33
MGGIETDTVLIVGMFLALGAGALSFLSPCVLPIFPAYLSYITGISVKELQGSKNAKIRRKLLSHSLFFILGVSLVFISLGIGASFLGRWIQDLLAGNSGLFIQRIAGIFIIVMGLFVAGWLNVPTLMKEKRLHYTKKRISYVGTFFVGTGFAAGWTPCIGPIFASILFLAASNPGQGIFYTFMYVIGFALPFLILTFFLGSTKWIVQRGQVIMKIGGIIMIAMGIILFTGQMPRIAEFFLKLVQDTWLEKLG